ncbi:hypothetical protein NL108_017577 [Boleophthalmus pectinirostris]|nr:hypothetical protein NL108_017577 [Boleophthalmus pectinirostris]
MDSSNITVVLSQPATRPINFTVDSVSHEHRGVWTCWDDGAEPRVLNLPWHHFLLVQDDSAPVAAVTIDVLSHNRTQFLHNELMTVGCRLPQGEYDRWRLMRACKWTGMVDVCPGARVSGGVLSCSQRMGFPWSDWLFWCQNHLNQQSNVLNISNTVIHSVLEAPPLPVMEGDDITLRCLEKDQKTGVIRAAPAFYKHRGRTISWSTGESFTVKNVTKLDEGLYSCRVKSDVTTGESYITVTARPQKSD